MKHEHQDIIDELGTEHISVGVRKTGKIRKVVVDRDACIGAQSCVVVTPDLFQMDDENLAYVTDKDHNLMDDDMIRLSAESCPVLAIHLYDEDGNKIFPV
ncbi:MAG: ferredoxin [Candidatus Magasanikbacteria bacterium]|uniref:Ferredoxin n=1 Tax=Candidatus Magasanikbacteria bacterium CG10_big_fil_rev_8_21_14_0_10_38_6 TaxID=1974647 RepID=A0A2M6P168_9BACT|nr:ferredoxin [Candidatus Magasanikbacteria bacterium]NCS72230.1 ferredoxin [Candidatus Magasanikbacteria bacterium]PIR77483.1 MAG: ferredoxin [Candidatus Magasanikbacteria bacterium CG10_big_fil_rev_8_21_14_0_10_38_6]